jgi:hypothetical protein
MSEFDAAYQLHYEVLLGQVNSGQTIQQSEEN